MSKIDEKTLVSFFECCQDVYLTWSASRVLFTKDSIEVFKLGRFPFGLGYLSGILQEHFLMALARLHDPLIQNGHYNLSIRYVVEQGSWSPEGKSRLIVLEEQLSPLGQKVKAARSKRLAHNDLVTIISETTLGGFDSGEDEKYFDTLQLFMNELGMQSGFGTHVLGDAMVLIDYGSIKEALLMDSIRYRDGIRQS